MSHTSIQNSFNYEIVSAILTKSLDNTNEYVIEAGVAVLCPPPNSLSFLRKLLPSLNSNITRHLISWYPIGRYFLRFLQTSNAGRKFLIYFRIESRHSVSPFYLSISISPFIVFVTLIPHLCVLIQNLCVFEMIRSRFLRTYFTHHTNAGSSYIRFSTENSDIWTGYKYFTSFSVCQVGLAYLQ